jgi:hypothetical protein
MSTPMESSDARKGAFGCTQATHGPLPWVYSVHTSKNLPGAIALLSWLRCLAPVVALLLLVVLA